MKKLMLTLSVLAASLTPALLPSQEAAAKPKAPKTGCTTCDLAGTDTSPRATLKIRWKRLVIGKDNRTAPQHAATGKAIEQAFATLKRSLSPLGIEVSLQKTALSEERYKQDPLLSNRIWLNGASFEMYLPKATAGKVVDKASGMVFRTVVFAGRSFRDVPADMIVQAGLIAAAESVKQALAETHALGSAGKGCCDQPAAGAKSGCCQPPAAGEAKGKSDCCEKPAAESVQTGCCEPPAGKEKSPAKGQVNLLIAASVASATLLAAQQSRPAQQTELQDWPQWMGPQRDGVWRETGILARFPDSGLAVKWRTPIHAGFSGPSVAGDRVYVTDFLLESGRVTNRPSTGEKVTGKERVLCLDAATGKPAWQHAYPVSYTVSYPSGPRASPLVSGGKVYTLGTDGNLFCLDVRDGSVVWQKDFKTDYKAKTPFWGHSAHPLLHDGLLFCLVGGPGSTVAAFDKDTGKERWRALDAKEPGYAPPVLAELAGRRTLLVWHPESLNALDPGTGKLLWSLDLPAQSGMSVTAPLVSGNRIFVSGIGTRPASILVAEDGHGATFDWRGHARKGIVTANSTPLLYEGVMYGADTQGRLIASLFGSGQHLWKTQKATPGDIRLSYATVFLVRHGPRFFLFNEAGDLILAEASEDGYTELSRFHVLEPTTETYGRKVIWSHPAFARRCVFARNDREIVCVSLAAR